MGSEWGVIGNSDPSGSTPRTEEVSAIHWFAASRSPKATQSPNRRPARAPQQKVRGTIGATVKDASRESEQTAPNPGTS
jgi:hypothetical protein